MPLSSTESEALDWLIRLGDPRFQDWDLLTDWLNSSPEHGRALNTLQLAEAEALDGFTGRDAAAAACAVGGDDSAPGAAANDNAFSIFWKAAGAIAALLALVIGLGVLVQGRVQTRPQWREIRTAAGERRELQLADGTQVTLNGASFMKVAAHGRYAVLVNGEALFVVSHNPAHPFVVTAGEARITDIGTRFDVVKRADEVIVGVAEGTVAVEPNDRLQLELKPGQGVSVSAGAVQRFGIHVENVASWMNGRLRYDGTPVEQVVADVSRATGIHFQTMPNTQSKRFSGTILLGGSAPVLRERLANLLGTQVVIDGASPEADVN